MITEENIEFLKQLVNSLEKAEARLGNKYKSQSYEEFNKIKKFIIEIQKKISEVIE